MILSSIKTGSIFTPALIVLSGILFWWNGFITNISSEFNSFGVLTHFNLALLNQTILSNILGFVIVVITAFVLNQTIDQDEFFDKNTFLPAFFYIFFMGVLNNLQVFNPIIISNLILTITFRWYLKIKRQEDAREIIFNASFYLSLSILVFPVLMPLIISPFILLLIFRPFVWREWALSIIGIAFPVLIYLFFLYFFNIPLEQNTYNQSFWLNWEFSSFTTGNQMLFSGYVTILLFLSLYVVNNKFNSSSIRLRKFFQFILFELILFTMASVSLYSFNQIMFPLVALPLALIISYYFYYAKKLWANLFFYLLILSALLLVYFS